MIHVCMCATHVHIYLYIYLMYDVCMSCVKCNSTKICKHVHDMYVSKSWPSCVHVHTLPYLFMYVCMSCVVHNTF